MEDGCTFKIPSIGVLSSVMVGPLPETKVGDVRVWDLRNLRKITIPDGAEMIGNYWFCGSEIQSATIPAGVKSIGVNAFSSCKKLKTIMFAEDSVLEEIKDECFCDSGLTEITFPRSLKELGRGAFRGCRRLKQLSFQTGSKLWSVGTDCLKDCGLKKMVIPATLIDIGSSIFAGCDNLQII